jgi:DNA-directed RNA polymerase beta subunit
MWEVLDSYFKESGLVKQQLESYNRFAVDISEVIK